MEVVSTPDKQLQGAADQVSPPKRLRLRSKLTVPLFVCSFAATDAKASADVVVVLPSIDVTAGAGVPLPAAVEPGQDGSCASGRVLYLRFHSAYVRWQARKKRGEPEPGRDGTTMHDLRCSGLRSLTDDGRFAAVQQWAAGDDTADVTLKQWALENYKNKLQPKKLSGACFLNCSAALLTWNGDWGLFTMEEITGASEQIPLEHLCAALRTHERMQSLEKQLCNLLEKLAAAHHIQDHAYSFEVCTQTYEAVHLLPPDEKRPPPVRVHVHAFLRSSSRINARAAEAFVFCGAWPVKSSHGSKGSRANSGQGLYYVQCQRSGRSFQGGACCRSVITWCLANG